MTVNIANGFDATSTLSSPRLRLNIQSQNRIVACFFLLVSALSAHADGAQPVYDISDTLLIAGASSCSPGCNATINFSFGVTYVEGSAGEYDLSLTGCSIIGSGLFNYSNTLPGRGIVSRPYDVTSEGANYMSVGDPFGDEFDLYFAGNVELCPELEGCTCIVR